MSNQKKMQELIKACDCKSKEEVRNQIDIIDQQLIQLFAIRYEYVEAIVKFKDMTEEAIIDSNRKELVIEERSKWAAEHGLDKETFARLFRELIDHNISKEMEILQKSKELKIG